jgi:hypothetical protein
MESQDILRELILSCAFDIDDLVHNYLYLNQSKCITCMARLTGSFIGSLLYMDVGVKFREEGKIYKKILLYNISTTSQDGIKLNDECINALDEFIAHMYKYDQSNFANHGRAYTYVCHMSDVISRLIAAFISLMITNTLDITERTILQQILTDIRRLVQCSPQWKTVKIKDDIIVSSFKPFQRKSPIMMKRRMKFAKETFV